jgi:hypothetical protein
MVFRAQLGDDATCAGCGCGGPIILVPCCPTRKFPARILLAHDGFTISLGGGVAVPPMADIPLPYEATSPNGAVRWATPTVPVVVFIHTGVFFGGFEILMAAIINSCSNDPPAAPWNISIDAFWPGLIFPLVATGPGHAAVLPSFGPGVPNCIPLLGSYTVPPVAVDPNAGEATGTTFTFYE